MARFYVALTTADYCDLVTLAVEERRPAADQAAVFIAQGLRRARDLLLTTEDRTSSMPKTGTKLTHRDAPVILALTPPEAAAALRMSKTRLYDAIRTGALASYRVGRSRRIMMRAQVPASGPIPVLCARPDVPIPTLAGVCGSCGELKESGQTYVCRACQAAKLLALLPAN